MLGSVKGSRVVELGAGIGRFTGELASSAQHVLAVDFMDNLIAQVRCSIRCRRKQINQGIFGAPWNIQQVAVRHTLMV